MYVIKLTPKNKAFKPHIWKEGGEFQTDKSAEFQAKQLRAMKAIVGTEKQYSKIEIVPVMAHSFDRVTQRQIKDAVELGYVVFYNINWDKDGQRIKLPKAIQVLKSKFEDDFDFLLEGADYLSDKYEYCVNSFEFKN